MWQQLELASGLDKTEWTGAGSGLSISELEKLNLFHLTDLVALMTLMWKCRSLFLKKNLIIKFWDYLSLLNWIGALTLSLLLKLLRRKFQSLFMKFLSPEVALYLYTSTIQHCCIPYKLVFLTATCYFFWTLGSSLKCIKLKFLL